MSLLLDYLDDDGCEQVYFAENAWIEFCVQDTSNFQFIKMVAELIGKLPTNKSVGGNLMDADARARDVSRAIDEIAVKYAEGDEKAAVRIRRELAQYAPYFRRVDCAQVSLELHLDDEEDRTIDVEEENTFLRELAGLLPKGRLQVGRFVPKSFQKHVDDLAEDRGAFEAWLAKMNSL